VTGAKRSDVLYRSEKTFKNYRYIRSILETVLWTGPYIPYTLKTFYFKMACNCSSLFRYVIFLFIILLSVAQLMFLMRTSTLRWSVLEYAKMEEMFAGLQTNSTKNLDSTPDPPSGRTKEAGDVQERSHSALPPIFDEVINVTEEAERCHRYDYGYDRNRTIRRRIFMGGPISDDTWHPLEAVAAENYGIFHVVAFVESNETQNKDARKLRYTQGSEKLRRLQGGMIGPDTSVHVNFYLDGLGGPNDWHSEHLQREVVLQRWKKSGMKPDDIGLLADVDETFTRDFLRAAQICDIPVFRKGQDC
jgi:hypothetical protein